MSTSEESVGICRAARLEPADARGGAGALIGRTLRGDVHQNHCPSAAREALTEHDRRRDYRGARQTRGAEGTESNRVELRAAVWSNVAERCCIVS
jgi:hypothetical protein